MLTATYTPHNISIEIIDFEQYPHRRQTAFTLRTMDGSQPFKQATNEYGATFMTDTTRAPKALLSDIRHDGLTVEEAALLATPEPDAVAAALDAARAEMTARRLARMEYIEDCMEERHESLIENDIDWEDEDQEWWSGHMIAAAHLARQVLKHMAA